MPKIKILPHDELCPNGAEIEATVGMSVCENLLNNSIDIEHACESVSYTHLTLPTNREV